MLANVLLAHLAFTEKASHPRVGAVEHRDLVQMATLLLEMEQVLLLRYVCCAQHSQLLAS